MSQKGVKLAAKILSQMQEGRNQLIALGCGMSERDKGGRLSNPTAGTRAGHQDILLGHLFDKAKDAIKDEFAKLVDINNIKSGKR